MSVRTFPYRTPAPERVAAEPWHHLAADGLAVFGGPVPGWDYITDLRLTRRVMLDLAGIRTDSGLPPGTPLRISVRSRPSTSLIRTLTAQIHLSPDDVQTAQLDVLVPGRDLSGSVMIETVLELAEARSAAAPFTANRVGSILWRDETGAPLEGDSGLLPVAPAAFSELSLPTSAAWYISLATDRWDWPAMGSLLVLLNTDNPAVTAALPDPATGHVPQGAGALFDTLEVDFLTDLVGRALDDEAFHEQYVVHADDDPPDDDYSLGSLVRALVRTRLTGARETVDAALQRLRSQRAQDPSMFRALVQHSLRYPRSTAR